MRACSIKVRSSSPLYRSSSNSNENSATSVKQHSNSPLKKHLFILSKCLRSASSPLSPPSLSTRPSYVPKDITHTGFHSQHFQALEGFSRLAAEVEKNEPDCLVFRIHENEDGEFIIFQQYVSILSGAEFL